VNYHESIFGNKIGCWVLDVGSFISNGRYGYH